MKRLAVFLLLVAGIFIKPVSADTLVLVQGYLGSAGSWRGSGIAAVLQQNAWCDAGHLSARPQGIVSWPIQPACNNRFYTIDLPTEAPIEYQISFLAAYLKTIRNTHKNQPLHIAGHSAGGVVARATMVAYPDLGIKTLITIASPHRGTDRAETGLTLSNSPVGWFAPMMGAGTLNRSRVLYAQLVRERPGTYLGWLNHQPHPKARYVSIIRAVGDGWVPTWSQDMNGVAALAGKSEVYPVAARHTLNGFDGLTILNILNRK